jgi:hypothetical protein
MSKLLKWFLGIAGVVAIASMAVFNIPVLQEKQLVLYHLVPLPPNPVSEPMFRRGLSSQTLLARDLMIFDLPTGSGEIRMTES